MSNPSILRNTALVGAFTMLSRVLGLIREMLQSRLVGAGVEQSAFVLAFAIPNMSRKLVGEGALTAAFVPVFRGEVEKVGVARAARLARAVLTMLLLGLGAVVAIGIAGLLTTLCAGESLTPRARLTMKLVLVLLPYMLAICAAAFGMGVLNALGRFRASSFVSSLLNVFWILALAVIAFFPALSPARRVMVVSAAILVGGVAQALFMFRCMAKVGVSPRFLFSGWRTDAVRLVWRNTAVAALGAGAVQINYALDQVLAQLAAPWAAGVIGYAERLMDLPLGVIGVAFGTVLLPTFAGHFARGDLHGARHALASSVRSMLFVMLPAAVGLALLSSEAVRVIYQGGSFDGCATLRVSRALAVYAAGLCFFGLQKSAIPWFQAQNDMATPLRVSVATVVLNAVLNVLSLVLLPVEWRHVGFAASTVLCAAVGTFMLIVLAVRRNGDLGLFELWPDLLRILLAAGVMAVVVVLLKSVVSPLGQVLGLAALAASGAIAYLACVLAFVRGGLRDRLKFWLNR